MSAENKHKEALRLGCGAYAAAYFLRVDQLSVHSNRDELAEQIHTELVCGYPWRGIEAARSLLNFKSSADTSNKARTFS